jgi:hypothetical protein
MMEENYRNGEFFFHDVAHPFDLKKWGIGKV